MVVWKEALYVAGIPEKRQKRIMKSIEKKRPVKDVYLLTAPSNEENCLEYVMANQMLQPYYRTEKLRYTAWPRGKRQPRSWRRRCYVILIWPPVIFR